MNQDPKDFNNFLNEPKDEEPEEPDPKKKMDRDFDNFDELNRDDRLIDPEHNGAAARAHELNLELIDVIKYRNSKKWHLSFFLVLILFMIIFLMMAMVAVGKDVTEEWKEVLLVLLGAFVASFSKLIDFWFNNQEAENALLEASQDVNGK
ncbi:MAG: hypothetical protein CL489_14755 [Acidobacteria bacterium]|nr:hypothetical protein [Acidobacteriota bacterium]|tara:strand:- start:729 stop:1178 length:450 start_codon:yes stop_codon:yes gene_type:complete